MNRDPLEKTITEDELLSEIQELQKAPEGFLSIYELGEMVNRRPSWVSRVCNEAGVPSAWACKNDRWLHVFERMAALRAIRNKLAHT